MPELPDLVYIEKKLAHLAGHTITGIEVKEPVIIRNLTGSDLSGFTGRRFQMIHRHGPFLVFTLDEGLIVVHPMLAGAFSLERKKSALLHIDFDGGALSYLDSKKMGKIYFINQGGQKQIPRFMEQGIDVMSNAFTRDAFEGILAASRRQVRAFLMEQESLSAIGNAYADEILFEARIHPKTFCYQLSPEQRDALYQAIVAVLSEAIRAVDQAAPALHEKFREHVRVRNKKNEPCPRCGAKIRRESVLGYDTFFCPVCQPAQRKTFIDWKQ